MLIYPKLIWMHIPQFSLVGSKVLKPGPDRMVWSGKPQTVHFCSSFSLKNRSMRKKQRSIWTAVGPHGSKNRDQTGFHGSLLPIKFEPKKKKTQKRRKGRRQRQRRGGALKQPVKSEPKIKKIKKNIEKEKRKDKSEDEEVGVAPWSNCFFFFCFFFFFFFLLLLLCSSPSLSFLLNFVTYVVWFLTFPFFVFVMT